MQLGARRVGHCPSPNARLGSKLKTPVVLYNRTVVAKNRRLTRGSANSSEAESSQQEQAKGDDQIQDTLADLDALLGIEEEPEEEVVTKTEVSAGNVLEYLFTPLQLEHSFWPSPPLIYPLTVLLILFYFQDPTQDMTVEISPDVLKVIAEAESRRAENAGASSPEVQKKVTDSIGRIVEQARKLSESGKEESTAGEAAVRKEFENLLTVLTSPRGMSQEAIK